MSNDFIPFMVYIYGYFTDGSFYMKYFKPQEAFKLYVLYIVLWMHIFCLGFRAAGAPKTYMNTWTWGKSRPHVKSCPLVESLVCEL